MRNSHTGSIGCCQFFIGFTVTSSITTLFVWLGLRVSNPISSIQDIYFPALNRTANSTTHPNIYFDLKLDNPNWDKGIYYDGLHLTSHYTPKEFNRSSSPIGNMTIQQFYQGHNKKAHRREVVKTHGVSWEAVSRRVLNGTVVFRVDLASVVRFKILRWKTKPHKLVVGANLEVNESGIKTKPRNIRLTSAGGKATVLWYHEIIIFVLFLFQFY